MSDKKAVTIPIEAVISSNSMYLRLAGATAELADGRKLEVSSNIDQASIVVNISKPGEWKTVFFSTQALAQAALALVDGELDKKLYRCRHRKRSGERVDGCGWQGKEPLLVAEPEHTEPEAGASYMCCPECRSRELAVLGG